MRTKSTHPRPSEQGNDDISRLELGCGNFVGVGGFFVLASLGGALRDLAGGFNRGPVHGRMIDLHVQIIDDPRVASFGLGAENAGRDQDDGTAFRWAVLARLDIVKARQVRIAEMGLQKAGAARVELFGFIGG